MKYMLTWTVKPENQHESNERYKKIGANPPEGIEVINHYWNVNSLGGWAVFTATNHAAISKWLLDWTDLNVNDVTPVIEDEELRGIL